ncbi:MAG TPA: hypothetical protein VGI39_28300 [Polyangiaceae bacterium]
MTRLGNARLWVGLLASGCCGAFALADQMGCASTGDGGSPWVTGTSGDGGAITVGSSDGGNPGPGNTVSDSGIGGVVVNQDAGGPEDCPAGAGKFIYVVSDQNELYTFDPTKVPTATNPTNKPFTDLGALHCTGESTPPASDSDGVNSMAVDRQAIAWVNFNDGKIFRVDTTQTSLPCTDTNYDSSQGNFTPQLGMGFATASATDHTETLYVSDNAGPGGAGTPGAGKGLGWIDTKTMKMAPLGGWGSSLAGYNAELSGTGDGQLYGFFTTTPSDLATIDKSSGTGSAVIPLNSVNNSQGGYAFSFWGGDFWFYTAYPTDTDPDPTTSVTHFVSADGGAGVVMTDIGFTIVGAGASTCVPTVPPPIAK